jgi:putative acetyltransferase
MNIRIRPEVSRDIEAIDKVTVEAFRNAPHTDHTEQYIVKALRNTGALTISLVAELDGEVVGHVAISPVSLSDGTKHWYGLGPISVVPKLQGAGIGTQLMQVVLGKLKSLGASGCVLLGDPAYYKRFGFRPEPGLVLPDVPAEYFQVLSFGEPIPQGLVSYCAAFSATG